jgi:hypothetical protein
MKRVSIPAVAAGLLATFLILNRWSIADSARFKDENSNGINDRIDTFINVQKDLTADQRLALMRYAKLIQATIDAQGDLPFDEVREMSCILEISEPRTRHFRDLMALVKGKTLNSLEKTKKYLAYDAKFDGKVIPIPKVTRDECLR